MAKFFTGPLLDNGDRQRNSYTDRTSRPNRTKISATFHTFHATFHRDDANDKNDHKTHINICDRKQHFAVPNDFWDPLDFIADGDATPSKRRRAVELKHGRISMQATMRYITPEITGEFLSYPSLSAGLKLIDILNGSVAISKVSARVGSMDIVVWEVRCLGRCLHWS